MNSYKLTHSTASWRVIYPPTHKKDHERTRSVILVNKAIPTDACQQVPIDSPDVTAIQIITEQFPISIYNIYNDITHSDTIHALRQHFQQRYEASPIDNANTQQIWAGDFNRHHPLWDEPRNFHLFTKKNLDDAQILLDLVAEYNMQMCLPPELPTLEASSSKNYTRPDNVFCSSDLLNRTLYCKTYPSHQPPVTDHIPIFTAFNVTLQHKQDTPRYNYRAVDWDAFTKALAKRLPKQSAPHNLHTRDGIDYVLNKVMDALANTIQELVPLSKPSPFANRWWNSELNRLRAKTKKLSRLHYDKRNFPDHPIHQVYRTARNHYGEEIAKAKKEHWAEWLDNIASESIWKVHKVVTAERADTGTATVPPLADPSGLTNGLLHNNEDKGKALFANFFPSQDVQDQLYEEDAYPDPLFQFCTITDRQIARAISRLSPFKAAGPDGIPNAVIKYTNGVLIPYLGPIFRATFRTGNYPGMWKQYRTIVLRKPGKPDYTKAKAYRGIALLNTLSKVLSACVAEDLVYFAETLNLLPEGQFGGRPGRTTTDAIHTIINFSKTASRQGDVSAFLFLDVKGAFLSVVIPRLVHDMRMLGIPREYTDWITEKLRDRSTTISFDDYETAPLQITNGIDQGCPLSVILYLIYNASLLKIANTDNGELAVGFMDDVTLGARAATFELAMAKILHMLNRPGGAQEWSLSHNSIFEHDKEAVLGTTRLREPDPQQPGKTRRLPRPPLQIGAHTIHPVKVVKYLGVLLDEEFRFHEHVSYALAKGTKWALQVRRIARPSSGVPFRFLRQIYNAVLIPKMLYAADIFCANKLDSKSPTSGFLGKMARIQRLLTIQITGALRSTATDVLDIFTNLLPFKLMVRKLCHRALLRLATLPDTHPLNKPTNSKMDFRIKRHRTPTHHLRHTFDFDAQKVEKIATMRLHPKQQVYLPVRIDQSKDDALWTFLLKPNPPIRIFTDGSGYGGTIGGAAIMVRPNKPDKVLQLHLGPTTLHTVYEGELVGILLALHHISTNNITADTVIFTDNQATLLAINAGNSRPASYLVDEILSRYTFITSPLRPKATRVTFQWTPAHQGIPGNEKVDSYAKEAAIGTSSPKQDLPRFLHKELPYSSSALKQHYNATLRERHAAIWKTSPRAERVKDYAPDAPSPACRKELKRLPRKHASVLTQLRTGHIPLNSYLHRIKQAESPICTKCLEAKETAHHYIIRCPAYATQREQMQAALGHNALSLSVLLGKANAYSHLFKFINKTGRLKTPYGDFKELPEQAKTNSKKKKAKTQDPGSGA